MSELPETIADRIELIPFSGCWWWIGTIGRYGYGHLHPLPGTTEQLAHRAVFQLLRGEIPRGLVLDHLCRHRSCVNPRHLEPVTEAENILRGTGFAARNARKTECPKGHSLIDAPVVRGGRGLQRKCVPCVRASNRKWMQRMRTGG